MAGLAPRFAMKITASKDRDDSTLTPRGRFQKSGSEEFQSDGVRVAAREPRAVAGIDDATIL
jgi:hypothetical protein